MNAEDMQRLGIQEGERVRMWNEFAEVVVPCQPDKGECPPGLLVHQLRRHFQPT